MSQNWADEARRSIDYVAQLQEVKELAGRIREQVAEDSQNIDGRPYTDMATIMGEQMANIHALASAVEVLALAIANHETPARGGE